MVDTQQAYIGPHSEHVEGLHRLMAHSQLVICQALPSLAPAVKQAAVAEKPVHSSIHCWVTATNHSVFHTLCCEPIHALNRIPTCHIGSQQCFPRFCTAGGITLHSCNIYLCIHLLPCILRYNIQWWWPLQGACAAAELAHQACQ
jgi:hypothetical protein